jgi:hypothetical protein
MKYLFLIGTQHHLTELNYAVKHFNISPSDVLLLIIKNPNENFSGVIDKYQHFSLVKVYDHWVLKDLIFNRLKHKLFFSFINKLKVKNERYTMFSTVPYEIPLIIRSMLKVDKFYLLDDGLHHFTDFYFFKSSKRYIYILQLLIKSILYRKYIKFNQEFIYLTRHDFIVKNAERAEKYTIEKYNNPLKDLINDEVIFLGSCLVEGNTMKYENYMTLLTIIKEIYKQKKILYFPHRREDELNFKKIEALGYIMHKIDEPFENYFSRLNTCPSIICSFYSTAVIQNLALRFVNIPKLNAIKFNDKLLLNSSKADRDIYQQLKYINEIEIIDLT